MVHKKIIKHPLSWYEKRGYIVDDAFLEEYKYEIDWSKK
jgi:hypothetical protein